MCVALRTVRCACDGTSVHFCLSDRYNLESVTHGRSAWKSTIIGWAQDIWNFR